MAAPRALDSLQLDKRLQCNFFNTKDLDECQNLEPALKWSDAFAFSRPEELRKFANVAYDKKDNGDIDGWKVVMTAESSLDLRLRKFESFFARVYVNEAKRQMLVAIKGTDNFADLWADFKNVIKGKGGLQVDSVFTFGEELRKLIEKFKCKPQVIVTGHSLGGFLAQVLTFTLRNCGLDAEGKVIEVVREDFGLNTIVFDSPAAFEQIKRIAKNDPLKASCVNLPITNFVVKQNWINCNSWVGPHIGTVISLSAEEDLRASKEWKISKMIKKHKLKYFENISLDGASQVIDMRSAELVNYDSKRIPLLQFSQREQDALRLLPLTETITMNYKNLVPSSSLVIQDNEVRLIEDQGESTFIPRLRFYVRNNEETLSNLASELQEQFSSLMQNLLEAYSTDFNDLDLRLKPVIARRYQELVNRSEIGGLQDEKEQMLSARILKNSIDNFLFVKFDDFIVLDELKRDTWLRLNEGTLMLCQANGQRLDTRHDRKTKIFYLDSTDDPQQHPTEDCTSPKPKICPLKVTELDEESQMKLKERKLGFFGNEVEAGKIFLGLFDDLNVRDVIDFTCQPKDQGLTFYFKQQLKNNRSSDKITVRDLVSDIQMSNQQTFLISCNAGMGKSTNLKRIQMSLQKNLPHFWVVRLELASCSESLQKWILKLREPNFKCNNQKTQNSANILSGPQIEYQTDYSKEAVTIISNEIFKDNAEPSVELQRKVFSSKVAAGEVIFLLDAVDEVCPLYREAIFELLRRLKETGLKLLVATRPQEEKEVAQTLGIVAGDILSLRMIYNHDQAEFINQFWASEGSSSGLEAAQSLLDQLKSRLPAGVPGVPLNLRMIADLFPDGKLSEEFLQHGDLYKALIDIGIEKGIEEKFKLKKHDAIQQSDHDEKTRKYLTLLQRVAVAQRDGKKATMDQNEIESFNRLPFAVVVGKEVRFTHKTFQEYLIAMQLVRVMKGEKEQKDVFLTEEESKTILADRESNEIRAFVDTILSHTECSASSVREFFGVDVALVCLREQHLNIFKFLCDDKSICNNRIGKDREHPLEVILKNFRPKKHFVEYLLAQGARLEDAVSNRNCKDIFIGLIRAGNNECIKEKWHLFEITLEIDNFNPLVEASRLSNLELARFLIERGADVDKCDWKNYTYSTPLSAAIKNDDLQMVKLLMEHKGRVNIDDFFEGRRNCLDILFQQFKSMNVKDVNGRTLLMRAAEKGNADCVRFLLEKGADPEERDRKGQTCLFYAVEKKDCFEILFGLIPRPQEEKNNLLLFAADKGGEATLSFLLQNGASLKAVDEKGKTALHIASEESISSDCISVLLKEGADPHARNKEGRTPLHHAAKSWREQSCSALLEAKVQVDSRDDKGMTPLMLAARNYFRGVAMVNLLLAHGADPSLLDDQGWNCLHHAAHNISEETVSALCDKIPIDSRCQGGLTPLMIAAKRDNSKAVKVLLEKGADASLLDENGWNCLHHAAANGSAKCVKILRRKGVSLDAKTNEGESAFQLAEQSGFKLMATHLLRRDVRVDDSVDFYKILEKAIKENDAETMKIYLENRKRVEAWEFLLAAESGHLDLLKLFLPLVESVDVRGKYESTALMVAAKKNHVECVRFLLANGADPNEKGKGGMTSLDSAAWGGAAECFGILFNLVAIENRNLEYLLHWTANNGKLETFLFLLEKGADPEVLDERDNTCLHFAARNKNAECLEFLLRNHSHRIDVNARNHFVKQTALHLAAEYGGVANLQLLVQHGADVNARDYKNKTALHYAADSGRAEICEFLSKSIPIDSRDREGKTPLMLAAGSREEDAPRVIEFLLENGADPKLQDEEGKNCLHRAASRGRLENVKVLCERVPLEAKAKKGETALQMAEEYNRTEVAAFLRAKIAEEARAAVA